MFFIEVFKFKESNLKKNNNNIFIYLINKINII